MTEQKKVAKDNAAPVEPPVTGLALLRVPFPPNAISQKPAPTAAQTKAVKDDYKKGIRCEVCKQWHHPKVVHIDYVGHAALTDRLLDCDPNWNWEPVATDEHGLPMFDRLGGMWIKLTVCGQTRLGYGDAQGKQGPNAVKECIGDALRNAAMRFGAALDLWHKGDLHADEEPEQPDTQKDPVQEKEPRQPKPERKPEETRDMMLGRIKGRETADAVDALLKAPNFSAAFNSLPPPMQAEILKAATDRKAEIYEPPATTDIDDEIPH